MPARGFTLACEKVGAILLTGVYLSARVFVLAHMRVPTNDIKSQMSPRGHFRATLHHHTQGSETSPELPDLGPLIPRGVWGDLGGVIALQHRLSTPNQCDCV